MAARKTVSSRSTFTAREVAVILEDLRGQFTVFGESLGALRETQEQRFNAIDERFERIDERFERIDERFERIDERFEGIDGRFEGIDKRLDRLEGDVGLLKLAVVENSREIKELRQTIDEKLESKVESIVERSLARRDAPA